MPDNHSSRETEMKSNRCAQCGGRLGLGVLFKKYWGHWTWIHKRFCSSLCAHHYDTESHVAKQQGHWHAFLDGQPSQADYMRQRYDS